MAAPRWVEGSDAASPNDWLWWTATQRWAVFNEATGQWELSPVPPPDEQP